MKWLKGIFGNKASSVSPPSVAEQSPEQSPKEIQNESLSQKWACPNADCPANFEGDCLYPFAKEAVLECPFRDCGKPKPFFRPPA